MMRSTILTGIQSRVLVISVAALLIFFGIYQLRDIPVGVFPEYSPVYIEIQTEALGLSANEIEQIITVAMEQDLLNGIAYVKEIWSESIPGLSRIVCVFEPGTDPMIARQVVAERLTQAHALPNVAKAPLMLQPYSSTSRIMKVGLSPSSPDISLIDLSVLARWTIQPYLLGVEGVANVSIWGQRKRQLQVQVDPQILADNDITLHDVIQTTGEALWISPLSFLNSSTPGTGGFFDTPNQRIGIRHVLPISTPEELAQVSMQGRKDLVLGDISTVVENHQPLIGDAIINGNEGLLLVIEKFPWASTVKVSEAVEDAMDKLAPGLSGIAIDTEIYQPATFIESSFENVSTGITISIVVVAFLFFLFFYEWRAAIISFTAMLLSLIAGTYILYLRGVIFDMMVMAGFVVALGIIIDDAISTVENIRRRMSERLTNGTEKNTADIILDATLEMRSPIAFATGILLLAALPLFFMGGLAGSFLQPLALSYILALVASSVTALLVTPAMCMWLYSNSSNGYHESTILAYLRNGFSSGVTYFIQKPKMAYVILGILAIIGFGLIPMTDFGLQLPKPQERDIVITWEAEYGTSHPEMAKITKDVISKLRTVPGINNAAAHIGRAVLSDKINNVHYGEIWLSIDDDADYTTTIASIQKVVSEYPDMNSNVMTYGEQSLSRSLTGIGKEYAIRVYGENQETLTKISEEIKDAISGVSGLTDAKIEYPEMEPTIEIEVDLEKARQYNIKPGDVRRTAATLLAGIEVGSIFEGQKIFDVVVWGVPEVRKSIESVENLLVDIPGGNGTVRIGDVANVRENPNPAVIKREKISRYMDVSFTFSGSNTVALNNNINIRLQNVKFPLEHHAELIGEFEEIQVEGRRAISVVIAALIGIFLLLQAAFWSWRRALAVFPLIFLALSGGMIGVVLSGGNFSLGVLVGFLAVLGIAAQNIILLIKCFKSLEMQEGLTFGPFLVMRGVHDRLGPILMTTIITLLAFLPFAILGNVPGLEIIFPMSLVVISGVITTLLLNLFVLPGLYLQFGKVTQTLMEEEKAMIELDDDKSVSA